MFGVDRMSRWRRRLTGAILAAIALILLDPQVARAEPSVPTPPSGFSSQFSDGNLSEADRNFLIKVRLAGLFPELSDGNLSQADRNFLIKVRLAGLGG